MKSIDKLLVSYDPIDIAYSKRFSPTQKKPHKSFIPSREEMKKIFNISAPEPETEEVTE